MPGKRSVALRILGHEYRVRTDAEPVEMERIAALVEDVMARTQRRTGAVDSLDLALMTALNLANDLVAARRSAEQAVAGPLAAKRVRALADEVEAALRGSAR
jgi:cell division protein ZapA (FtsZ GTPase activity inhibitor)